MIGENYIYRFPELYSYIHKLDETYMKFIYDMIDKYGNDVKTILDPACGPGNILMPFENDFELIGNDYDHRMLEYCKNNFGNKIKLFDYDMKDINKINLPIDCIINSDNSIMHLGDINSVYTHLLNSASLLTEDGIYILGLYVPVSGIDSAPPKSNYYFNGRHVSIGYSPHLYKNTAKSSNFYAKVSIEEFFDDKIIFNLSYDLDVKFLTLEKVEILMNMILPVLKIVSIYNLTDGYSILNSISDIDGRCILILKKVSQ